MCISSEASSGDADDLLANRIRLEVADALRVAVVNAMVTPTLESSIAVVADVLTKAEGALASVAAGVHALR